MAVFYSLPHAVIHQHISDGLLIYNLAEYTKTSYIYSLFTAQHNLKVPSVLFLLVMLKDLVSILAHFSNRNLQENYTAK